MVLKIVAVLAVIVTIGVAALFVNALGESSNQTPGKAVERAPGEEGVWDGRGEHVYNMEIPDGSGALFIDEATFSGLKEARATVIVRMRYLGNSLPSWIKSPKSFSAFYKNSDDPVSYSISRGPLEDNVAVIDLFIRKVPTVRLDSEALKGLFLQIIGPLQRGEPFYLRISAAAEPGYRLGGR